MHRGRPKKSRELVKRAIKAYYQHQGTATEIAKRYHMSRRTLYRKLDQARPGKLTRRQNLYLMRKYTVELIQNGGRLFTGLRTTLLDTQTIIKTNIVPSNTNIHDVEMIEQLKRAFRFIETTHHPLDVSFIKRVNRIAALHDSLKPGHFATQPMGIETVNYEPPLPSTQAAATLLQKCIHGPSVPTNAVKLMLQLDRHQFFWDGNKRTAWLAANYYLLRNGAGILNIDRKQETRWNRLLHDFYETGRMNKIAGWLKKSCLINKI